jgi:hypothetical protein
MTPRVLSPKALIERPRTVFVPNHMGSAQTQRGTTHTGTGFPEIASLRLGWVIGPA